VYRAGDHTIRALDKVGGGGGRECVHVCACEREILSGTRLHFASSAGLSPPSFLYEEEDTLYVM
jgi:hypothetical protein